MMERRYKRHRSAKSGFAVDFEMIKRWQLSRKKEFLDIQGRRLWPPILTFGKHADVFHLLGHRR